MPKTYAEQFFLDTSDWRRVLSRNLRLLGFMARTVWVWGTVGRRARRAYRQAIARGEPFYVDAFDPARRR